MMSNKNLPKNQIILPKKDYHSFRGTEDFVTPTHLFRSAQQICYTLLSHLHPSAIGLWVVIILCAAPSLSLQVPMVEFNILHE